MAAICIYKIFSKPNKYILIITKISKSFKKFLNPYKYNGLTNNCMEIFRMIWIFF